jgi:DHA2 family methylenomycin A resistance protein-like MFS transporter
MTAMAALANIAGGRISGRLGFRVPMVAGLLVAALGYGLLGGISAATPFPMMILPLMMIPAGLGLAVPAMTSTVLASVDRSRSGAASAVLNASRQIGGAIGVALFGAFVAGDAAAISAGVAWAFSLSAVLLGAAALLAAVGLRENKGAEYKSRGMIEPSAFAKKAARACCLDGAADA